jgi:hypothetical protein
MEYFCQGTPCGQLKLKVTEAEAEAGVVSAGLAGCWATPGKARRIARKLKINRIGEKFYPVAGQYDMASNKSP